MITPDTIREGLSNGEFYLEYMPTVSLVSGRCVGAEALARWRKPSRVVQPDEFIGIMEGSHLAGTLTYWVFETVAKELGDWLRAHNDAHVGINVPPQLLGRGGLDWVAMKTGLSEIRHQIIIEVTERGIPDSLGVATLDAASKAGIRVALDDVTLSGSNLAVLSRLALDLIKTDRSLVAEITPECPRPAWLVGLSAVIQSTGLRVICEGVENESQAQALRDAGVAMGQGYHFSRPISAEGLKEYYSRVNGSIPTAG